MSTAALPSSRKTSTKPACRPGALLLPLQQPETPLAQGVPPTPCPFPWRPPETGGGGRHSLDRGPTPGVRGRGLSPRGALEWRPQEVGQLCLRQLPQRRGPLDRLLPWLQARGPSWTGTLLVGGACRRRGFGGMTCCSSELLGSGRGCSLLAKNASLPWRSCLPPSCGSFPWHRGHPDFAPPQSGLCCFSHPSKPWVTEPPHLGRWYRWSALGEPGHQGQPPFPGGWVAVKQPLAQCSFCPRSCQASSGPHSPTLLGEQVPLSPASLELQSHPSRDSG